MEAVLAGLDLAKMTEIGVIALLCVGFLFILREQAKGMSAMMEKQQQTLADICAAHGETARMAVDGYNRMRDTLEDLSTALEKMAAHVGMEIPGGA